MQQTAITICQKLQDAGYEAFFAGGAVRDLLRGEDPNDIDIATNAKPEEIENIFKKTFAIGKHFGVILVEEDRYHFEIATFRNDGGYTDGRRPDAVFFSDKKEDAFRRDFTVNALFWDPVANKIHDFIGGVQDLQNKILRFVGVPDERIREDFLRILRAVRFKNKLNFTYDPKLIEGLKKHASLAGQVSAERIREELQKMLISYNRVQSFCDLEELGILPVVLPELSKLAEVPNSYNRVTVLEHTLSVLGHLQSHDPILSWAALFHDLGKATTIHYGDRNHYPNHQNESAKIARKVCRRMKFSRVEASSIEWLCQQHIRFYQVPQMKRNHKLELYDHPLFENLITLCKADALASDNDSSLVEEVEQDYENCHFQKLLPRFHPELLTGKEIIEITQMKPGKKIGEIKKQLRKKQLQEEIKTKEEAKKWVEKSF